MRNEFPSVASKVGASDDGCDVGLGWASVHPMWDKCRKARLVHAPPADPRAVFS